MQLILFADDAVGLAITRYLLGCYREDLSLIVTTEKNDIYRLVEGEGIRVCVFESEEDVISKISGRIDLGLLVWWPKILKSALLQVPHHGFVNTHPSLLPYNRGKHYNFWALVEQNPFGVTLHRVDDGVDTGDIVAQCEIPYGWCDNGESLYVKAQDAIVTLFYKTYPALRTGKFDSIPQKKELGSFHYSSEMDKASKIDLDRNYRARDLLNLLRARTFEGYPGCWFEDGGARYEVVIKITNVN